MLRHRRDVHASDHHGVELDELAEHVSRVTPCDPRYRARLREILRLRADGYTAEETGRKVGITRARVCIIMRGVRRAVRKSGMFEPRQLSGRSRIRVPRRS